MRRFVRGTVLMLVGAAIIIVPAVPAYAATVPVTTAADVVNGGDGLTSLREAVSAANAAAGPTTIQLAPATTYTLTRCGVDDDSNVNGDLDLTAAQSVTVSGGGSTVSQTCAGQRVLHTGNSTLAILQTLTITGGHNQGAAVLFGGDLDLSSVTVSGNDAGGNAVISSDDMVGGFSLDVVSSTIGPNTGTGIRIYGAPVTITDSVITQNSGRGVGLTDAAILSVSGSTITLNGAGGVSTSSMGDGTFTLTNSLVTDNDGTGVTCNNCGDLTVTASTVSDNGPGATSPGGGIAVYVDQDQPADQPFITITDTTVENNTRDGRGGGLGVFITELVNDPPPAQIVVTRSTFAGNSASGVDGRGGGIYAATGEVRLTNSTLTGNSAQVWGGAVDAQSGDIFLRHATVYANIAPHSSNLRTGEDLNSFASVVAVAAPGAFECYIVGTTISTGYNVGGDGSCVLVSGPGDQNTAGDPLLLPLADNGGPTRTHLPAMGSPLRGNVPAAACNRRVVDQRGIARPQGTNCETGAVEVNERSR